MVISDRLYNFFGDLKEEAPFYLVNLNGGFFIGVALQKCMVIDFDVDQFH